MNVVGEASHCLTHTNSMSHSTGHNLSEFHWEPQPRAARLVRGIVTRFLDTNEDAARLSRRMYEETGTRFQDWIDHILVPETAEIARELDEAGFGCAETCSLGTCCRHSGGLFPPIILTPASAVCVKLKVESVSDFLAANGVHSAPAGRPLSSYREAMISAAPGAELFVVERHGFQGFEVPAFDAGAALARLDHLDAFRMRRRACGSERAGFEHAAALLDAAVSRLGAELACDLFFAAEREYWQRRNRAARVQKARQDALGLGWANHDHHTYRSSREWFSTLIAVFERLGFHCRERFYAGRDAGWGAQILEHPVTGVVIFADVDMSPDELVGDFAHEPLPARRELGTVGLWCALHGEAFLEAGMHHLECTFDFEALRQQLSTKEGIEVMKPFTDFPHLRQAFTEGERWPVSQERVDRLLSEGRIEPQQAEQFRLHGAIGSHMENLERNDGFKGFNQQGVSEIIAGTDPRLHMVR